MHNLITLVQVAAARSHHSDVCAVAGDADTVADPGTDHLSTLSINPDFPPDQLLDFFLWDLCGYIILRDCMPSVSFPHNFSALLGHFATQRQFFPSLPDIFRTACSCLVCRLMVSCVCRAGRSEQMLRTSGRVTTTDCQKVSTRCHRHMETPSAK